MNGGGIHPDPIHPFGYLHVGLFCDSYLLRSSTRQGFFFSLSILWCSQSDDPSRKWFSQNWLYTRNESREKAKSLYVLGYLLELIIKIWRFGILFFLQNLTNFLNLFIHKFSFCVRQWAFKTLPCPNISSFICLFVFHKWVTNALFLTINGAFPSSTCHVW